MRHIPGDSFINNTGKYGKYFKRGIQYTLKRILFNEEEKIFKSVVFRNEKSSYLVSYDGKKINEKSFKKIKLI